MKKKGLLVLGIASAALGLSGITYSTCMLAQADKQINQIAIRLAEAKGEEEDILKKLIEELIKFKDNTLIPILGGSIGVSIVPLVTSIFNFLRTKKVVDTLKITDEELVKVQNFVTKGEKILEECQKIIASNEEVKALIGNLLVKTNEAIKANKDMMNSLTNLKSVVVLLVELEAKVASISENAIASGIIEDVNNIKEIAAKL